MAVLCMCCDQ